MKITLLIGRAGANFSQSPGEEIEVSEEEGARMIAAGQAVKKETAARKPTKETRG